MRTRVLAFTRVQKIVPIAGMILSVLGIVLAWKMELSPTVLYGSFSYASAGYTPAQKLFALVIGYGGIMSMALLPNKRIPIVSEIGKNTFPIFCLHGFAVRLLDKMSFFTHGTMIDLALTAVLAMGMMAAFGNGLVARLFNFVFSEKRLEKR